MKPPADGKIQCGQHGRAYGYLVCTHVLAGSTVAHYLEAHAAEDPLETLGEVLCADCLTESGNPDPDSMKLICAHCVRRMGLTGEGRRRRSVQ